MRPVLASTVIAAALLCLGAAPDEAVSYQVTPVLRDGALDHLAVEMRLTGEADGSTRIYLSDWGSEPQPWSRVGDLSAEGGTITPGGPQIRLIRHRPSAPLVVRYRVLSAHPKEPSAEHIERVFRPVIRPNWFAVYGETVFAKPENRGEAPARFSWGAAPDGWRLASDLDHPGERTVDESVASFLVGAPDLRLVERTVLGGPLRVAFRGDWSFSDDAFVERLTGIARAQREFWGDEGAAFFVPVLGLPPLPDGTSTNGTGRGADAFALFGTTNIKLDDLTWVLAHEQLHSWIDGAVGRRYDDEEGLEYWFSEGFTNFYTLRTLLRSGVFTLEDHARELNDQLGRYAASAALAIPNARIPIDRFQNRAVADIAYDRGHFFAALLDHEIRGRTGGRLDLDDVMQAQRRRAADLRRLKVRHSGGRLLPIMAREVAGLDISDLLARHIVRGERILLPADLYGDCARIETVSKPDFHRGFDIDATQTNGGVITGVRRDGPAYAAGLRDGMKLVKRDLSTVNDSAVEIGYRVADGGTERLIRYLPAGRERLTVQRVVLASETTATRRTVCARRISGA